MGGFADQRRSSVCWGGGGAVALPEYANNRTRSTSHDARQAHLHEQGPLDGGWADGQLLPSSKLAQQAAPHTSHIHFPKGVQAQLIGSLLLDD